MGRVLVRDDLVLSRDMATLTAIDLGLAMVDLRSETIEHQAVLQVPEEVARKYMDLPLIKTGNRLTVAMTDSSELQFLQDLAARKGCSIDPVITTEEDIQEHVNREYRLTAQPLTAETLADAAELGKVSRPGTYKEWQRNPSTLFSWTIR